MAQILRFEGGRPQSLNAVNPHGCLAQKANKGLIPLRICQGNHRDSHKATTKTRTKLLITKRRFCILLHLHHQKSTVGIYSDGERESHGDITEAIGGGENDGGRGDEAADKGRRKGAVDEGRRKTQREKTLLNN
ncbi:hypothetical protein Salat_1120100 [Sesamum alatum]|uniref:Uncharacterized protein n=1 Tax=Sesamum alatum TaxID=300844 RepID=A0AAE2CT66_9LAMI|nr:hypothetical protein Salat_1120100 [Sesamum alatum]